jgi:hypothetical protein
MANTENLFRFVSLRPTKLEKETGRLNFYVYPDTPTDFYREVVKAIELGATKEELVRLANWFKSTADYISRFDSIVFPVNDMITWISTNGALTFDQGTFIVSMENIAGESLEEILKDDDFKKAYNNLRDSILADILASTAVAEKEDKITALKVLYTLKAVGENRLVLIEDEIINQFFGRSTVIFPVLPVNQSQLPKPDPVKPPKQASPDHTHPDKVQDLKNMQAKLAHLDMAHKELTRMALDERFRAATADNSKESKTSDNDTGVEFRTDNNEFILSQAAYNSLSADTKHILTSLNFESHSINPFNAVSDIENQMLSLNAEVSADYPYHKIIAIGGTYLDAIKFGDALREPSLQPSTPGLSLFNNCSMNAGIGDLLIVRQRLKAYELAEFAHVENALAREFREKVHRRLDVTETITETIRDTETEKERDLQTTERSEMQTEAERVVQEQSHLEAGLQVSGSYGPSVSFTASLNAGFSSSVEETISKSTSYSREVTDKSSERVRSRITESQRRRVLAEIEETNTHRIDNTGQGAQHIRGVYRWLNKIYDAQIFNYGQRMMYEFVIPEPAAYFLYATVQNPPADTEIIKPEAPTYQGQPLKPSHLTRANYQNYISLYQVPGAFTPPSQFTMTAFADKLDGTDNARTGRGGTVKLPDGYEATGAVLHYGYIFGDARNVSAFFIGGRTIQRTSSGADYYSFTTTYRGELTISGILLNIISFALGIDIVCSLTAEAFAKWQIQTYDAIIQAYQDQKAAYDAEMERRKMQQGGINILGRNPLENRRIEKEELRKLIIMILTNTPYLDINSYIDGDEPIMDLERVCPNGALIRFFENAFEWQNIVYVLYPYFWGRHSRWINAIHITDPDLDFAAFLKAGAARVQIPVRPGFEKAVAFFCQTGIIWDGNDVPLIGDDLYVPIVKEIAENLGGLDEGVPYPEDSQPWEVTIPTSLVVLQDLEEIPGIRDMITGELIDLENAND